MVTEPLVAAGTNIHHYEAAVLRITEALSVSRL
jgi:hypothetical protein